MAKQSKTIWLYRTACQTIVMDYSAETAIATAYVKAKAQRALGFWDLPMMQQNAMELSRLIADWHGGAKVRNQLSRVTW